MAISTPEHAIVIAGGRGTRLHPYTADIPKPLVRLGGHTILEIVLRQLRSLGVARITLCVSFRAEMIMTQFGDGSHLGIELDYCIDREPRGTAGPLADVKDWNSPAMVMNADVLTSLNLADVFLGHIATSALLTIAAHTREIAVDYGVLGLADDQVVALTEKPIIKLSISAGIYVISPEVQRFVPDSGSYSMTDLVHELIRNGKYVRAHKFTDDWYDIGTPERLTEARRSIAAKPDAYLREAFLDDSYSGSM